jgi:hypothetical protein
MLSTMMTKLETDLRAASEASVTQLLATARSQLEEAIAEVAKERADGLAEVEELRAQAVVYAQTLDEYRTELQCEIGAMQTQKEQREGRVLLNVGGYRYETSVQTLRRVPRNLFDAYFSGRYAQEICTDGSNFVDRDGILFGHVLQHMREGVVSVVQHDARQRAGLLRRLKREFSFSLEMGRAEQGGHLSQVNVVTAARRSARLSGDREPGCEEDDDKQCEEEMETEGDKEKEEHGGSTITTAKIKYEATRRNKARRDAAKGTPIAKWCNLCLQVPLSTLYL